MEVDLQSALSKVLLGLCTALISATAAFLYRRLRRLDSMVLAQARCLIILRASHEMELVLAPPDKADAIREIVRNMDRELEKLSRGAED